MGGSSGGGGHTPYEAPDSLKSAQRLRAIGLLSLGPIRGAVTPDEYQSAFFDYTPLKNRQGEWNYLNTEIQYNLGTQDQLPLKGFEMSEREVPVGAEVKKDHALARSVIDPDITRLRITLGVNALFSQNNQGDTNGTAVDLRILINGVSRQSVTISGKSSSRFHRSYLIDNLPPRPFTVTVKRITPDSKSQRLQNGTFWASYTEIIDTKLSYPNMAVVGIKTDSRYNPNFPNMNFLLYGRLVKVPSNYDPDTRTYGSGLWRGDFKLAWTNNPAWVFYDLVTNKLAGLGQRLGDYGIDKFQLYQIAQYCDQMVPDGYGGLEPRMQANLWITEQRDAYSVISDMASVFRAIVVWNGTQLTAIQDRTADPVCSFTQANVIEGKFNRQYVPLKSIFTAVEIEYADERNNYQKAIEYVSDDLMIARYGYNVKKIVAFACTTRGQARRYGKWILETSRLEQCTITFSVGREGLQVLPGDIIEIADKSYANINLGGRVLAISGRNVTLDAPIDIDGEQYLRYLRMDDNGQRLVRHKILQKNAQNRALVTLDSEPTGLQVMDTWALHSPLVSTQRYRVLSVSENTDGSYAISALQHEPQKEEIVDNGAVFEPSATTLHKINVELTYLDIGNTASGGTRIRWESTSSSSGVVKYDIRLIKEGKLMLYKRGESSTELDLENLPDGEYTVTIIARNEQGQILSEKTESFTIDRPPVPTNVAINGGLSDVTLSWDYVNDFTHTEIWASETDDITTSTRVAKVLASIYSHQIGARQTRYYWLRHTRGTNAGAFYQQQGLRAETGADIDEELRLLNEKLSEPIINQVLDTAIPARQLEMVKTVLELGDASQFLGHNLVMNLADNRLYKWDGRQYTHKTPASEIDGAILPSQLPPIPTTQLSGAISAGQIASNAIGANHLQANSVDVGKIAANAVTSAAVAAGAIRAEHVAVGELTADKLAVGLGGNLIPNAIMSNNGYGWDVANGTTTGFAINREYIGAGTADWTLKTGFPNERILKTVFVGNQATLKTDQWTDCCVLLCGVIPGKWYMFSAYVASYRCSSFLLIEQVNRETNAYINMVAASGNIGNIDGADSSGSFVNGVESAHRHFVKFRAPSSGKVRLSFRVNKWLGNNPDAYFARPMLEECTEYTKEPSPWQNSGVTAIHGGSIVTETITADKIGAGQITTNHMVAGSIDAKVLKTETVTASKVVASISLTSPNINGGTIKGNTISGGNISGTTITGANINGNNISGGTISGTTVTGTTINGGTIKGARLEAVTGKFTGELEVTKLIGGGVIEQISGVLKKAGTASVKYTYYVTNSQDVEQARTGTRVVTRYQSTVNVAAAPNARYVVVDDQPAIILPAGKSRTITVTRNGKGINIPPDNGLNFMVMAYSLSTSRYITIS